MAKKQGASGTFGKDTSGSPDWEFSARSDTGSVRKNNEDFSGNLDTSWGKVLIVADGMGGHNAGAKAARLTVWVLRRTLRRLLPLTPVEEALRLAFERANQVVYRAGHGKRAELRDMGSTVVVLLIRGTAVYVAHAGDSRAYLFRRGHLRRLTKDHSLVQRLVDMGLISEAEARVHPDASVISRAVGARAELEAEIVQSGRLRPGDGFLLCSDGLSGYVDDREIEAVLRTHGTVPEATERLIQLALGAGGEDNVTVQYLQYGGRVETWPPLRRLLYRLGANC